MPSDGYWEEKGAVLIGSKVGAVNSVDDMRNAVVQVPIQSTPGQFVGSGWIAGQETAMPSGLQSGQHAPYLRIHAGVYLDGGGQQDTLGSRGLLTYAPLGLESSGHVQLLQQGPDADPWVGEVPPYPATLDYLKLYLDFGNPTWTDGSLTWHGTYEIYLYNFDDTLTGGGGEPGAGVQDPIICPVRPKWPYVDPVQAVTPRGPARIRRSRP